MKALLNLVLGPLFQNLFGALLKGFQDRQRTKDTFEAGATAAALNGSKAALRDAARMGAALRAAQAMTEKDKRQWL